VRNKVAITRAEHPIPKSAQFLSGRGAVAQRLLSTRSKQSRFPIADT